MTKFQLHPTLNPRRKKTSNIKEENTMVNNTSKGTLPLVSGQGHASQHAASRQGLLSLLLQRGPDDEAARSFLLRVVQPGLTGLMDGSVSTLAPIFATAFATHTPFTAFLVPDLHVALLVAYIVVAIELVLISAIRHRFFGTSWWLSALQVVGGGALVFVAALIFGNA
jgi:hypothetical protein